MLAASIQNITWNVFMSLCNSIFNLTYIILYNYIYSSYSKLFFSKTHSNTCMDLFCLAHTGTCSLVYTAFPILGSVSVIGKW